MTSTVLSCHPIVYKILRPWLKHSPGPSAFIKEPAALMAILVKHNFIVLRKGKTIGGGHLGEPNHCQWSQLRPGVEQELRRNTEVAAEVAGAQWNQM